MASPADATDSSGSASPAHAASIDAARANEIERMMVLSLCLAGAPSTVVRGRAASGRVPGRRKDAASVAAHRLPFGEVLAGPAGSGGLHRGHHPPLLVTGEDLDGLVVVDGHDGISHQLHAGVDGDPTGARRAHRGLKGSGEEPLLAPREGLR